MNHWIFQAISDRYDLREELVQERKETWYATRYRTLMTIGDIVFFWLGGSPEIRGIYGWGKLTSVPYQKPEWDSWGVDVKYEERLVPHISIKKIESDPALKNLLILRAPFATNFLINHQEAFAIANLIDPKKRPKLEDI